MNNKIVWYIVGAVVVVGAIVLVVMHMSGSSTPGAASNSTGTVAGTNTAAQPMSMKSLLASGESQKCTFNSQESGGTNVTGVVYVTSGHMRGDFMAEDSSGKTIMSHMITDGTTSYVWVDGQTQGYKMSFASMEATSSMSEQSGSVDPDQQMNYSCNPWSPDNSEFSKPASVTFADMSAMMNGAGANVGAGASAGTGSGSAPSNECAMCNSISNSSQKAECLQAMGCQ